MTRIFISHSHSDEIIADLLVDFLGEAMELSKKDIRCTSDPNHGLDFSSASISEQLKNDLKNAGALIVLVTVDSLRSPWILFEVGSFWTTNKLVAPIVGPGLSFEDLPGPLKGYRSIRIGDEDANHQLNELVNQLNEKLSLSFTGITRRRANKLSAFITQFRDWESNNSEPDTALQEQVEKLKLEFQTTEQSYQQKLQEKDVISQQNQQKLEEKYEKQQQSLQDQIRELSQQLKQEKSQAQAIQQNQQKLEEKYEKQQQSLQDQIRELSQQLKQEKSQAQAIQQKLTESEAKNAELHESIVKLQEPQQSIEPSAVQNPENALKVFSFEICIVNSQGKITHKDTKQAQYFSDGLGKNVDLEVVYIPGGQCLMGAAKGEKDADADEYPQHQVIIQPFLMGRYPVTQAQWRVVAALPQIERELTTDPSCFKGDNRPVEKVSWYDAVEFCARLSQLTKQDYRLPSEAEWEYACRAGTTTPFYFGKTIIGNLANYDASYTYLDETKGKYQKGTTPVGQFPPNANGLFDMHGNVWEWCADTWHENYQGAPTDGAAWIKNGDDSSYCVRGGSWINSPWYCRSACRYFNTRDNRDGNIGFRVSCELPRTFS